MFVVQNVPINRKGYSDRLKNAKLTARGEFQSAVVEDNVSTVVWNDSRKCPFRSYLLPV